MANDVTVRMSAENAEMVRAWMESLRGPQAFSQELDKIAQKGRNAGRVTKDAIAGAGSEALRFAGALTGVGSTLAAVSALAGQIRVEYEAIIARQKESGQSQVAIYPALMRAVKAHAGKGFDIDPDQLLKQVLGGAHGVDPGELLLTLESGISASGDQSPETVLQTVLKSAEMSPEMTLERRQALVTGALQLKKGFPEATPEEALAGVQQSFVAARTEDVTDFAKNVAPGIAQMRAFGGDKDSYEYLASLAIAIGQRSGDPTGRRSMNATINMLKQVKEETLAAGLVGPDASVEEQMTALQNNPELQKKMLGVFAATTNVENADEVLQQMRLAQKARGGDLGGELSGEAKSFIAMVEALSPGDNKTKQEMAAAREKITGLNQGAVEQVQEARRAVAASDIGQAGELERVKRQADMRSLLTNPAGEKEKALELIAKVNQEAGMWQADRQLNEWGARLNNWSHPKEHPLNFDTAEDEALHQRDLLKEGFRSFSPQERERRIENIDALIEEIRKWRDDVKAFRDAKDQKVVRIERDGAGVPAPAAPGL